MEFLKKHYEKVVLGIVLLALTGVAIWLPMKIQEDKAQVASLVDKHGLPRKVAAIEPTDISKAVAIREQTATPPGADFSGDHNLFNSVRWMKTPEGLLEKMSDENYGAKRVTVEKINPLNFTVEYERKTGSGYQFRVTKESADRPTERRPRPYYATLQSAKNDVFTLKGVNGPEDEPLTFDIEINDTGETIVVPAKAAYTTTNGYSADLSYSLEKKTWKDARVKQELVFANDTNIVVDINPSEVILRAVSNEKTTIIPFNAVH